MKNCDQEYSSNYKLAIIGLGYVGLPLAVEFGKARLTLGFDINQDRINELKSGKDSTLEVTTEGLLAAKYLEFSGNVKKLRDYDIFIITVPTPIDAANRPDLKSNIQDKIFDATISIIGIAHAKQ